MAKLADEHFRVVGKIVKLPFAEDDAGVRAGARDGGGQRPELKIVAQRPSVEGCTSAGVMTTGCDQTGAGVMLSRTARHSRMRQMF